MHFLASLGAVLVWPRSTMRRILDGPLERTALLLFVLAVISGMVGDSDVPALKYQLEESGSAYALWIVAGVVVLVMLVLVALFWFYSWVPYLVGRFLGGTGDLRSVRLALAWGLAPAIWALVYRIPVAIWIAPSAATAVRMREGAVAFDLGRIADGCGVALLIAFLELIVFVWCGFVMSNTVAEAHGFSVWHGLGTLAIAAVAPLVVVLAAVLAVT